MSKLMDNNVSVENGNAFSLLTIFLGLITWLTENSEMLLKGVTGVASLITAFFAIRYYIYATKAAKKKLNE